MLIPVKLKELGDIITGNTPSKKEISYWDSKDICFVKPDSISEQGISIVKNTTEYLSEKASSKARIVTKDAVFVTCIGTIGKIGLAAEGRYAFNQQINVVVPNTKVLPKYLAYALLSSKKRLEDIANAPVVPIINKTQFGEFSVKIEDNTLLQKDIVNILDKVVGIIDFRRKELQCLDNLVKARFVEMFGDPITNSRNWPIVELGSLTEVGSSKRIFEKEYVSEGIPFYRTKEIVELSKGNSISTELYISRERYLEIKNLYGVPQKDDLLISAVGTIGTIWVVDGKQEFYFKDGNLLRIKHSDKFESVYMKYLLECLIDEYKNRMSSGTAYAALTISGLSAMKIYDVPKLVQHKFTEFAQQIDKSKVVVPSKIKNAIFAIMLSVSFGQITSI